MPDFQGIEVAAHFLVLGNAGISDLRVWSLPMEKCPAEVLAQSAPTSSLWGAIWRCQVGDGRGCVLRRLFVIHESEDTERAAKSLSGAIVAASAEAVQQVRREIIPVNGHGLRLAGT